MEEVVTKYIADVSDFTAKFQEVENRLKTQEAAIASFGEKGKEAFGKVGKGAEDAGQKTSAVGKQFEDLGKKLVAAFAVERVIAFGASCVKAFNEAELNARKLQAAVSANGGLQKDFEKLLKQSQELQKITIFSDDDIQKAQTLAAQYGLNADAIEKLIPLVTDFASATGQDLENAMQSVIQGVNGNARALKIYGVQVDAEQTRTQRFASIQEQLTQKFAGQAQVIGETSGGSLKKLANAWDDLKESIGGAISPFVQGLAAAAKGLISLASAQEKAIEPIVKIQDEFNNEVNALKAGNLSQNERKILIDEINKKYGEYLPNLITEKTSLKDIEAAQAAVNEQFLKRILLAAQEKDIAELTKAASDAARANVQVEIQRAKLEADKIDQFGTNQKAIERLNGAQELNNAIIDKSKTKLSELTKQYDALAKQLGITSKATGIEGETDAERAKRLEKEKKARDDAEKDRAESFKRQQDLNKKSADDTLKKQIDDLEIEKQNLLQSAEFSAQEKLKVDFDFLEKRRKLFEDDAVEQRNIDAEEAKILTQIHDQSIKDRLQADADHSKQLKELSDKDVKAVEDAEKKKREAIAQTLALAGQIADAIFAIQKANSDSRIQDLESQKQEQEDQFTAEEEALNKSHDNKKISERKFEADSEKIKERRVEAEKKINKELAEEKRKQAIAAKDEAIFRAVINTAVAILKLPADGGLLGLLAVPAMIALGALEIAAIIAAPIPKFAKGKRQGERAGLSMVGEQGAELMFVPDSARILPANKVTTYGEAIDAMYGNKWESYINDRYITPALIAYKAKQDKIKEKSFSDNIAQSLMFNGGIDEYGMVRALREGNKKLPLEIAKALVKVMPQPYSAYTN